MAFFDQLKLGSNYHTVTLTSDGGFTIGSSDESREGRQRFVQLAADAMARACDEGYEIVREHDSSRDSYGLDMVEFAKIG
jgi:hypothetical protein